MKRNDLGVTHIKGSEVRAARPKSFMHHPTETRVNGLLRHGVTSVYNHALRNLAMYNRMVSDESYIALVLHLS